MRNNTSIITNFLTIGLSSIIGGIIGYFIANKKYIFQKTYDQKLMHIIDLYKQIVNFEFILNEYVHFIGADTKKESIPERIEALNKIKKSFQEFQHKFWEVEIIFDDSTANQIGDFLKKYIEITSKLTVSNIQYQLDELKESIIEWDKSFKLVTSDLKEIRDKLKKEFRKTLQRNY